MIVILDDIVGSGCSIVHQEFDYRGFLHNKDIINTNVIFSPISSLKSGLQNVQKEIDENGRTNMDFFRPSTIVDYNKFVETFSEDEKNMLGKLLGDSGYCQGNACTATPYMLPDNNTFASGFLLEYFINNPKGNKSADWFYEWQKNVKYKAQIKT